MITKCSRSTTFFTLGLCFIGTFSACKKDSDNSQPDKPLAYITVTTLAGNGTAGYTNGAAATAQFSYPEGAAVDAQGNIYVADSGNNIIRKITPNGVVVTYAGNGSSDLVDGPATSAGFYSPMDVALDGNGNLYVADAGHNCIRKIAPTGAVSTLAGADAAGFADGTGLTARFNDPLSLAVDAQGNVYVADSGNRRIRKITPAGVVSTLAGSGTFGSTDGPGNTAQFKSLEGLAVDKNGTLYVADYADNRIRKITSTGVVSTLAGNGTRGYADGVGSSSQFAAPVGLILDAQNNLYVTDINNHCIRRITPAGEVSTLAGSRVAGLADGPVATAQFKLPTGITIDSKGVLYVTDLSHRIRTIADK